MSFDKSDQLSGPYGSLRIGLLRLGYFDASTAVILNRTLHLPGIQQFFAAVSTLGNGRFWYALMIWVLLTNHESGPRIVLHALLTGSINILLYKICKRCTHRPRPYAAMHDVLLGACPLDKYSFPSGHTMHAVAFTLIFVTYIPFLFYALLAFTICVALSRVILGLHYPSDVIWGAALGFGMGELSLFMCH